MIRPILFTSQEQDYAPTKFEKKLEQLCIRIVLIKQFPLHHSTEVTGNKEEIVCETGGELPNMGTWAYVKLPCQKPVKFRNAITAD